jgi:iron complex outermembrane receptor protein
LQQRNKKYICNNVTKIKSEKIILVFGWLFFWFPDLVYTQGTEPGTVRRRAAHERGTLSGQITNEKGEPLAGASVFIHDVKAGTIADNNGNYTTPSISVGRYLVEVTYQGYSSAIEQVMITANAKKNFVLTSTVVEQQGVTVTGVSSATRLKQSPQPVSLVRRADLLKTSSNNLIEALARKSGVSAISTGPAIAKPVIRGLSSNRVVTINDGVRQEGQQWGDEHGIEIDEYSVQRAEILKGPASLMYGSDAMAGVINIITNQPVERGAFRGNVLGNANTNNGLVGLNANLAAHYNSGFNWNFITPKNRPQTIKIVTTVLFSTAGLMKRTRVDI